MTVWYWNNVSWSKANERCSYKSNYDIYICKLHGFHMIVPSSNRYKTLACIHPHVNDATMKSGVVWFGGMCGGG